MKIFEDESAIYSDTIKIEDKENAIEETYYDQLQQEVRHGAVSPEEADQLFWEWRSQRLQVVGQSILRAS
jgi:hypothetical protein